MSALLNIEGIGKRFGGYVALTDVSSRVEAGTIHALIGPNGAGKTTLFNIISGVMHPTSGTLAFAGEDYTRRRADRVLVMGVARNFQQVRLFRGLSVVENIMVGAHARMRDTNLRDAFMALFGAGGSERAAKTRALNLLSFVGMRERSTVLPADLTLVEQRRLEIARALASEPRLLLLDEPGAGMNPTDIVELRALLVKIAGMGVTIFFVDHNMRLVMNVAEKVTVLAAGRVIAEGIPGDIQRNDAVIAAYLGNDR